MIEFMDDRHLAGWRLEDFKRIGGREVSHRPVGRADLARVIGDLAVLEARHVLLIGRLALFRERQFAATDELDLSVVLGCPPGAGDIRSAALPEGRSREDCRREYGSQSCVRTDGGTV